MGGILTTGRLSYSGLVGTGGIGWGSFFLMNGNQTLGREESRGGRYMDRRDYCKLHIICHYVKTLLGDAFAAYPVGKVGGDAEGEKLLAEMRGAGLDLRHVDTLPGLRTLYSFCFVYPDGAGGNLTLDDSASSRVDEASVRQAEAEASSLAERGIALAVAEVPLAAREALLDMGGRHGMFRAAGFSRGEMEDVRARGLLDNVDLLAVNLEEAVAAAGLEATVARAAEGLPIRDVVEVVVTEITRGRPRLHLSITAGAQGSWCCGAGATIHFPALRVPVASTAGAGDAHLAGTLAGLAAGLDFPDAHALGSLLGAASVTSAHTIHPGIDRAMLCGLCEHAPQVPGSVRAMLGL